MVKKFTLLIFLIIVIFLAGFIFLNNRSVKVEAGSADNVYGWAWSENIGWISFNCTNQGSCGTSNYGVNINSSTGLFSGYAWSEHIGWIQFNPAGPYPASPSYSACVDLPGITTEPCNGIGSYNVGGWARVLSTVGVDDGWDGWIKLRGTNYGVSIDTGVTPYQFRGWAWSDVVIGWISFNCSNQGVCGTSNYKVMTNLNASPTVTLAVVTGTNYCNILPAVGQISFQWRYDDTDGDDQSQYNLQVATDSSFTNLVVDAVGSQSIVVPPAGNGTSAVQVKETPTPSTSDFDIGYGGSYYWRVRAKAATGNTNWSDWAVGPSFSTPAHGYPWIDFSWAPQLPAVDELTQFADQSLVFGVGVTKSSWFWEIPDWNYATGSGPTIQNPLGSFTTSGDKDVYLTVTDSPTGFSCRDKKTITSQLPLPEWKEIAPF